MIIPEPAKAEDFSKQVRWGTEHPVAHLAGQLDGWYVEPKLDGARVRVLLGEERNTVWTSRDRSDNFPHLRDAVLPELAGTILDAELTMPANAPGMLGDVVGLCNSEPFRAAQRQRMIGRAHLHLFDLLAIKGTDITFWPLEHRRAALEQVAEALGSVCSEVRLVPSEPASVERIEGYLAGDGEGVMLKRAGSRYIAGQRMPSWRKVKRLATGDFFIVGFKAGKGRNEGRVGSVKLAYHDAAAETVIEVGDARGFDDATCIAMTGDDGGLKQEWIGTVVEVAAQGVTKHGRLRHPRVLKVRTDKVYTDCGPEQIDLFPKV